MGLGETTADATAITGESDQTAPSRHAAVTMDRADKGSEALVAEMAAGAMAEAIRAAARPAEDSRKIAARRFNVRTDPSRDALLTDFGKETLDDRYLLLKILGK